MTLSPPDIAKLVSSEIEEGKYVTEIRRLDKSTARAKVKEQIIQKCAQNLHIKNAWSRYILSNESARDGLGLDHTVGSIGRYLDHYFDNIGMTPPDF